MAGEPVINAEQLMGFMDGSRFEELSGLVERVEGGVEEQLRLADRIARGTRTELAAALYEILHKEPELAESPVIKKIEAEARPKHKHTPLLDACLEADVPAYLHGEAGSGKSTAAENAAAVRQVTFRAISMSPTGSDAKFLGYRDAAGTYHETGFREIYENGGIFLFDEIDNGNPSSTAVMNRALSGFENEFPDGPIERNWATRVVAAANTIGKGATAQYVGRNPLDAATLDRFALIPWDIDERLEDILMKVDDGSTEKLVDISKGRVPDAREWLQEVRDFRTRAQDKGLRVVISPRSAIYGRKLAEQGVGMKWLTEMLIYKGMPETDRDKLKSGYF